MFTLGIPKGVRNIVLSSNANEFSWGLVERCCRRVSRIIWLLLSIYYIVYKDREADDLSERHHLRYYSKTAHENRLHSKYVLVLIIDGHAMLAPFRPALRGAEKNQ